MSFTNRSSIRPADLPCYTTSDEALGKPLPIDKPKMGRPSQGPYERPIYLFDNDKTDEERYAIFAASIDKIFLKEVV